MSAILHVLTAPRETILHVWLHLIAADLSLRPTIWSYGWWGYDNAMLSLMLRGPLFWILMSYLPFPLSHQKSSSWVRTLTLPSFYWEPVRQSLSRKDKVLQEDVLARGRIGWFRRESWKTQVYSRVKMAKRRLIACIVGMPVFLTHWTLEREI